MTDRLWKVLEHTNEWVRFADTKAAGALAASGVVGGLATNALLGTNNLSGSALVLVVLGLVGLLFAAGFAVWVLTPQLSVGEPRSLLYFEHVARRYRQDADGHQQDLEALLQDDRALSKQLANQIWANSTVARNKYCRGDWSLRLFFASTSLLGVGTCIAIAG